MTSSHIEVRIAFWPYWIFIYTEATIGFTLLLFIRHGTKIDWPVYGVLLIVMAFLSAISTWGMQWFFVARVSDAEIKGFNCLGIPTTMLWQEISKIRPLNFLGIKCLRIYSKRHYWALWFPLQILNQSSIHKSIAQLDEKPRQLLIYLERT